MNDIEGMEKNAKNLARLLKVLSNEYRLLILCYLIEEEHTVGALAEKISKITPSALSQHLAILKAHGIVDSTKEAQHVTYFILDERIRALFELLKEHYC